MRRFSAVMIIVISALFPARVFAVNFYDGYRAPDGMYFLTYSSEYYADKTADSKGRTARSGYGYRKLEELFRFCYYKEGLVLTTLIPAGEIHSGFYDVSSRGPGDLNLGAGYFLPVKQADILPMLFVKFPTGEYDSRKSVNYGAHQYDIKPTLFIYKSKGKISFDGAAKYFFRMENPATNVSPGDELYLQGLLGWQFTKFFKAGPSINWMMSSPQRANGMKVPDSRRESLSAGAELYFRFKPLSVTFTYLRDVRAKNTTKGDSYQIKTCHRF